MRRVVAVVLTAALLSLSVSASATETENYKDKFSAIGWGGSDGSLDWSGPWNEINDDGDEKKGNVRVVASGNCDSGNCMRISALTTLLGAIGAVRTADTGDIEDASLRFDLKATPSLLGSQLEVQVNGGGGWDTVADYQLGGGVNNHPTIDVSDYRSENFRVRFLFTGLLLSSEAFIDNVEILGTLIEEPTTTTTTTTVATTTTTEADDTTTTSQPSTTTTTRPRATTTTTESETNLSASTPATSTSTSTTTPGPNQETTTTTSASSSSSSTTTTTTTIDTFGAIPTDGPGSGGDGTPPDGSGIRAAARGLQANFQSDLFGDIRTVTALNGVDLQADYKFAVEVIRSSWAWMALLGLLIAWAIVTGLDRRRSPLSD